MKHRIIKWSFCLLLSILSIQVNAQDQAAAPAGKEILSSTDVLLIVVAVATAVVFFALIYMWYVLRILLKQSAAKDNKPSADLFTGMLPLEHEHELLMDHNYDGIRELDNQLPPWWVYMFYCTILFAVVYLWFYHIHGDGNIQAKEYKTELVEAEAQMKLVANKVDENSVKLLTDKSKIKSGEAIFMSNCVACHGKKGEGGVGPNLTDDYWLHGGTIQDIFKTVKYGVPSKGMISWKAQLSPGQIQEVSSYIKTLRGTNPPNGKAPQGELSKD